MFRRGKRALQKFGGKQIRELPRPKGLQFGTPYDIRKTKAFAVGSWAMLETEIAARGVQWKSAPELYRILKLKPKEILKFEVSRLAGLRKKTSGKVDGREVRASALSNLKLWGFDAKGI